MPDFFDIHTRFFTLWGYSMSYIEFFGVVTGGVSTWLVARNNVWTWPVAVVSVIPLFGLFYQVQLYPDLFLQVFFLVTYLRGWWRWTHPKAGEQDQNNELQISRLPPRRLLVWSALGAVATVGLGSLASRLHAWLPLLFSQPSAFPYVDSFTTVLSVIGTFLMIEKRVECWYVWLLADLILTYVYFAKGIKVFALEYLIYCFIAAWGAYNWTRTYRTYQSKTEPLIQS